MYGLLLLLATGCSNSSDIQRLDSGIEYVRIIDNPNSPVAKAGNIWNLNLKYYNSADSLLFSSADVAFPFIPVPNSIKPGTMEEVLSILHEGDSAHFWINAKSFYNDYFKSEVPKQLKETEMLKFCVKLEKILEKKDLQKVYDDIVNNHKALEIQLIQEYKKNENVDLTKLKSGIYKSVLQEGKGDECVTGKKAKINLIGNLLSGLEFENTYSKEKPIFIELDEKKISNGLDFAILSMKKGEKSIFVVPFEFGFGSAGVQGKIPPFSTLVFNIELIDFE